MRLWINQLFGKREPKNEGSVASAAVVESRETTDRLIEEHRAANARVRADMSKRVPALNLRYMKSMDQAMSIIRGE